MTSKFIILSAPSGSGKSTLASYLLSKIKNLRGRQGEHEYVNTKLPYDSRGQARVDALAKELQTLPLHGRNRVISSFRQQFNISSEKISKLTPSIPIVSEENSENKDRSNLENFWLIDTIDGT